MTAAAGLDALAVRVRAMPRRMLIDIAKGAKSIAAQQGAAAGSPLKGKKRSGMRLRAIDTIRDTGTGATLRVQGVNPAGWVWVTSGTRPHRIRRRKRGKLAKITVPHPGTSGRGAWRTVRARTLTTVVPRVVRDVAADTVRG